MLVTTTTNIIKASPKRKTKTDTKDQDNSYYGQLNKRNINKVTFVNTSFLHGTETQHISIPMIYRIQA